jgi:hypothetical protein
LKKNSIKLDEDLHYDSSNSEKSHYTNSGTNSDDSIANSEEKLNMEQNGFKVQKVNLNYNLNLLRDESNFNDAENLANGVVSDSNNNVLDEINLNKNDREAEINQTKSSDIDNNNNNIADHLAEIQTEQNAPESPVTSMQQEDKCNDLENRNDSNNDLVTIPSPDSKPESAQTSEPHTNNENSNNCENANENDNGGGGGSGDGSGKPKLKSWQMWTVCNLFFTSFI